MGFRRQRGTWIANCGKLGFATKATAEHAARCTDSDRGQPDRWPRPYACDRCGWFHTGHAPQLVADGVVTADEWFGPTGIAGAIRAAEHRLRQACGACTVRWSRVGAAWQAAVEADDHRIASKPMPNPGAAIDHLIKRLRRAVAARSTAQPADPATEAS